MISELCDTEVLEKYQSLDPMKEGDWDLAKLCKWQDCKKTPNNNLYMGQWNPDNNQICGYGVWLKSDGMVLY